MVENGLDKAKLGLPLIPQQENKLLELNLLLYKNMKKLLSVWKKEKTNG